VQVWLKSFVARLLGDGVAGDQAKTQTQRAQQESAKINLTLHEKLLVLSSSIRERKPL
jgi:hypothetical protein